MSAATCFLFGLACGSIEIMLRDIEQRAGVDEKVRRINRDARYALRGAAVVWMVTAIAQKIGMG
jgi:hypothetical protein